MPPRHRFKADIFLKSTKRCLQNSIVTELRDWLNQNTNLPKLTDEQLIVFLLSCNCDQSLTRQTICSYIELKRTCPAMHGNRDLDSENLRQAMNTVEIGVMPLRSPQGEVVIFSRLKDTNYVNFIVENMAKLLFMCIDLCLIENPPDGLIVVIDLKGLGLMHLTRLRIGPVKRFFQYVQVALPIQLKAVYIINVVYVFDKFMQFFKPFMKKELIDLIHLYKGSMSDFFTTFNMSYECIPCDYGGILPYTHEELSIQTYEKLKEFQDYFLDEDEQIFQNSI